MREAAVAIAHSLDRLSNYRGSFCIDGIATNGGFRPTEINTRWGAALTPLANTIPDSVAVHTRIHGRRRARRLATANAREPTSIPWS